MAEYIMAILRTQLMVVFSWGFHKPQRLPNDAGLAFMVDGFKYQGRVEVVYNDGQDLFEVRLEDGRTEDMVYCDNLVQVIDGLVERTSDYKGSVEKEYGITK
jgi:sRNA-binding regulator protein Hfq